MHNIVIDPEFRSLLPLLDKETYAALEANIIANGCRDSLVLWNGILIDGHNRYAICTEHDIPFTTVEKEFDSREDALIWIITNQVSRRNLNPKQLSHFRGLHYRADKRLQGNHSRTDGAAESYHNDNFQKNVKTATRLSRHYKVSSPTILRDAKASEATDAIGEVSPEAKRRILSEEVKIDKKVLETLASATKEEITEIAAHIEAGTYEKKKTGTQLPTEPETPIDSVLSGMQPLDTVIVIISSSLDAQLPKITKSAERTKLKIVLREYINRLEEQYGRI